MKTELNIRLNFWIRSVDAHGKILQEHRGHNIWLDNGSTWLGQLFAYNTTGYVTNNVPPDAEPAAAAAPFTRSVAIPASTADLYMPWLPFWIGLGVGGNQQSGPMPADVDADYLGTNIQSDADVTVTGLERAVRVRTDGLNPTVNVRWLMPVAVSLPGATPYHYIQFDASYSGLGPVVDINDGYLLPAGAQYASVPISEACLYAWNPDAGNTLGAPTPAPAIVTGAALAYETFPPIFKTIAVGIIATWQLIW